MMRARMLPTALLAALTLATLPSPGAASAPAVPPPEDARLAFRHVDGVTHPELILAQRVIDRDWGPSDDSIYVEVELPDWKSEPLAALLSAGLPGAGQRYVGERRTWMFATLEAAGWGGWWWYRRDAQRLRGQAAELAGPADDPASAWSFERWSAATQGDPTEISALYAADREAFFNSIASDPLYDAGWESADARAEFGSLRIRSDLRLRRSRVATAGLWINHLIASLDALRAARFHNMPLSRELGVRVDGHRGRGGAVSIALVRKF